jgi:hypothetical protein
MKKKNGCYNFIDFLTHFTLMNKRKTDWLERISEIATNAGHIIYMVTGFPVTRRTYVLWSCSHHPDGGQNSFDVDDSRLKSFLTSTNVSARMSQQQIDQLILDYPGQQFSASRMDDYVRDRTFCCVQGQNNTRTANGFKIFKNLLLTRGKHYNTTYTILIKQEDYKGKHIPVPIKCEAHNTFFSYSMKDLNTITSCPCLTCRADPLNKNVAVEIIKRRNAGRRGQVHRHANRVKDKYNNTCFLSTFKMDLHHHHLDGQDYYVETASS